MTTITLRPYQEAAITEIFKAWKSGKRRVMLQLPTGAGKSTILSAIARKFLERGMGAIAVAHRRELIIQLKDRLELMTGIPCGVIQSGFPWEEELDLQVGSIQSITRRRRYPPAELIIIDEAHHSASKSYTDLIDRYPEAFILGVTATPCRTDGQGFQCYYDHLVTDEELGASVRQLIEKGYLSEFKLFAAKPITTEGIKKNRGEFDLQELEDAAMKIIGDVLPSWEKYAKNKKTIVFCVGVQHSKQVAEKFREAGYAAEHIDGKTPAKERAEILERFESGEVQILCNCMIVTEGFDCPSVEVLHCLRPTCSLVLWRQMLGRALRPAEGKSHAIIIDQSENWMWHGLPDDRIEWTLQPITLKKGGIGVQECPECSHCFRPLSHEQANPVSIRYDEPTNMEYSTYECSCPSCHHSFKWEEGKLDEKRNLASKEAEAGEIFEVSMELHKWAVEMIDEIKSRQEESNHRKGWVYYKVSEDPRAKEMSLADWKYLASLLGYRQGWAYYKFRDAQKAGGILEY